MLYRFNIINLYTIWDLDHKGKSLTAHQKHSDAHQRVADYKLRNAAIGLQLDAWSECIEVIFTCKTNLLSINRNGIFAFYAQNLIRIYLGFNCKQISNTKPC